MDLRNGLPRPLAGRESGTAFDTSANILRQKIALDREKSFAYCECNFKRVIPSPGSVACMNDFALLRPAARVGSLIALGSSLLLISCSGGGHVLTGSTSTPANPSSASLEQQGPQLGYLWSSGEQTLRPVEGVPGASQFGPPLVESGSYLAAAASVQSGEALLEDKSGDLSLMSVPGGTPMPLGGVHVAGVAQIIFSPLGLNAAVFVPGQSTALLLTGLGGSAQSVGVQALGSGAALSAIAVSDTGAVVAASGAGPATLTLLTGNAMPVATLGGLGGIAFVPGGNDLLAMDSQNEVLNLIPGSASGAVQRFASSAFQAPFAVAASADGRLAVVANAADSSVVRVDLSNATAPMRIPCVCKVDRLTTLAGNAAFALSGPGTTAAWMVDASPAAPRTLFIPAMVQP